MTLEEIKELIQLVLESGIAELEVERGGDRVRIRRAEAHQEVILPQAYPAYAHSPAQPAQAAAQPPATLATAAAGTGLIPVKSPIVGTFFESPAPGAPPFVTIGDTVQPGQVLCIIESMKLMNEIEAEAAGVVVARHVENGKPVEYGETLFSLRPL